MKKINFLTFIIIFTLAVSFASVETKAYIPDLEENVIAFSMLSTKNSDILVGSTVEVYIVIKNYANFTLENVTITQTIPDTLTFLNSPVGAFNGTDRNYGSISVVNQFSSSNITLNYFSVTNSNFTMNLDSIAMSQEISFKFSVNVTEDGVAEIERTELVYYDHFGDEQAAITSDNPIQITSEPLPECEKCGYFPELEIDESNARTIFLVSFLLLAVAILSRVLYNIRPIA
ncbi:MAG: hypothetical protein ACXAC2_08970 [Candidatus Kariarchaeaceae archaeon]